MELEEKLLEMLSSNYPQVRYMALEQLRDGIVTSEAIVRVLEKASHDEDTTVAERAKQALHTNIHHQMAIKIGIVEPDKEEVENLQLDQSTKLFQPSLLESQETSFQSSNANNSGFNKQQGHLPGWMVRPTNPIEQESLPPGKSSRKEHISIAIGLPLVLVIVAVAAFIFHNYVITAIIGGVFLLWIFLSASTIHKISRIKRTHTSKISSLPNEGQVEVSGMTGQKILETPIKKTPCVFWQLEVQELIRTVSFHVRGKEIDDSWKTVLKKTSSEPFEINDGTGYILIKTEDSDLILSNQTYIPDLDNQTLNILDKYIKTTNSEGGKRNLAVYERFIAPEHQVYAIGEIHHSGAAFTRSQITAKVISDQDESGVLRSLYQQLWINVLYVIMITLLCLLIYIWEWIERKYNISLR